MQQYINTRKKKKVFFTCNFRSYYFHMQCLIRQLALQVHCEYHQRLELMTYRYRWRKGLFNNFLFLASKLLPALCQLCLSGLVQTQQQSKAESVKSYLEAQGLRAQPKGRGPRGRILLVNVVFSPISKETFHPSKCSFWPYQQGNIPSQ